MKVQRYEVISKWTNLEISKFGNEKMRELENEKIRKLGNGARATINDSEKIVSLFNFAKGASRTGREKISKLGNVEG